MALRKANGAPGEMAMSNMPTATGPRRWNSSTATMVTTGSGTTAANSTASRMVRLVMAAATCAGPSIRPIANMTVKSVGSAMNPTH